MILRTAVKGLKDDTPSFTDLVNHSLGEYTNGKPKMQYSQVDNENRA